MTDNLEILWELFAAFLGTLGFSLFWRVSPRHLIVTVPGGVLVVSMFSNLVRELRSRRKRI